MHQIKLWTCSNIHFEVGRGRHVSAILKLALLLRKVVLVVKFTWMVKKHSNVIESLLQELVSMLVNWGKILGAWLHAGARLLVSKAFINAKSFESGPETVPMLGLKLLASNVHCELHLISCLTVGRHSRDDDKW